LPVCRLASPEKKKETGKNACPTTLALAAGRCWR
jgi:hypothetical protein